jgi:hypothetical protein
MHPAEGSTVKLTPKIAGTAVAVLALSGAGIGTVAAANASTPAPAAVQAAHSEPASPDTDAIQQGDQTSPDTAAATAARAVNTQSGKADNPGEAPQSESNSASDGPGGHTDPASNAQHEFDGVE